MKWCQTSDALYDEDNIEAKRQCTLLCCIMQNINLKITYTTNKKRQHIQRISVVKTYVTMICDCTRQDLVQNNDICRDWVQNDDVCDRLVVASLKKTYPTPFKVVWTCSM